jgi:hypothetical protein
MAPPRAYARPWGRGWAVPCDAEGGERGRRARPDSDRTPPARERREDATRDTRGVEAGLALQGQAE